MKKSRFHIVIIVAGMLSTAGAQEILNTDSLLAKYQLTEEDTGRIMLLNEISYSLSYSYPDSALEYARRALEMSNSNEYIPGKAGSYLNIGKVFSSLGLYDQATEYFFQSLKLTGNRPPGILLARTYNHIGVVYFYLERYSQSLEYYSRALEIFSGLYDEDWIAAVKNNIGMIYEKMEDYEKSLEYFKEAAEINIKNDNPLWLGSNYGNLANVYRKMNDEMCLYYYDKWKEILVQNNNRQGLANMHYFVGLYYFQNKDFGMALDYFRESFFISGSFGFLKISANAAEMIAQTLFETGEYKEAYLNQLRYIELNDSLNLNEMSNKITRIEMKHQFGQEEIFQQIRRKNENLFRGLGIGGLIAAIVIVVLLIMRQRALQKKQLLSRKNLQLGNQMLHEQLTHKKEELKEHIGFLVEKNEILLEVIGQLNGLRPRIKAANLAIIDNVIFDLKTELDQDEWEEFEVRFHNIHEDFNKELLELHDNLTPNEQRLCAYIRLDMSTQEISSLTKQSPSSIDTARSRLRKKLGISDSGASLDEYLKSL